jgi:hypothetical protein
MAFCHIYARRDGTFTVRLRGTISRSTSTEFHGGTVERTSRPFATEEKARWWIDAAREHDGLDDMPGPTVVRRATRSEAEPGGER